MEAQSTLTRPQGTVHAHASLALLIGLTGIVAVSYTQALAPTVDGSWVATRSWTAEGRLPSWLADGEAEVCERSTFALLLGSGVTRLSEITD